MEYPGSWFTKSWRIAFFCVFIAAFFVISPIIILYTAGYRYDWTNGIVKAIGVISVDVEPKTASTYLNGIKIQTGMPLYLNNVLPGKYQLKLTKDGYYDWTKEITVENKKTVYIKEISLIKKNDPSLLIKGNIKNIEISPSGKYLLYLLFQDNKQNLVKRNLIDNQEKVLLNTSKNSPVEFSWFKEIDYAAASYYIENKQNILLFNAEKIENKWILNDMTTSTISKYQLGENNKPEIFFGADASLFSTNIDTKEKYLIGKNNYLDWHAEGNKIWTLKYNTTTKQYEVTDDAFGFSALWHNLSDKSITVNSDLRFLHAYNDHLAIQNNSLEKIYIISKEKTYESPAQHFIESPYGHWWVMWTPWELNTYSFGEDPYLLNRSGKKLNNVIVMDKFNTLCLLWEDKTTALFPYYYVNHEIFNKPLIDAATDSKNRILYYADNQGLWKMEY